MLIRSQDKKKLIPMMPLSITTSIRVCNGERNRIDGYIIYSMDNANTILGAYSTEEKAIKVLDMIQKMYCDCITAQGQSFYFAIDHPKVFQMPQDEEVQA